jgi:phage baseplate assembly protein W
MLTDPRGDRAFLGTGWRFPVVPDSRGRLCWSVAERSIEEAIWLILSTSRGERVMLTDFGCGVADLVFEPNSDLAHAAIAADIQQALITDEPRIDVLGVTVDDGDGEPNVMVVRVDYRVRSSNTVHNLVYPFFIGEGSH